MVVSGAVVWVFILFYTMAQAASAFLCPAVEVSGIHSARVYGLWARLALQEDGVCLCLLNRPPFPTQILAGMLQLTPELAGATLFALANGFPDLVTQISALLTSANEDITLAARSAGAAGGG